MNQFRNLFQTSLALAIMYLASYPFQSARATTATFTNIPASVSNTYTGTITLYINGLNAGDTVVVQKFLDLNSNGVIDSGDLLVQQFQLTDGQGPPVIATITNINIPGDLNPASGAVTAQLNPVGEGFEQLAVGQYLFKLSSPSNSFTPVTNLLAVTNFPFAQSFTGTVVSNGPSTIVPYAADGTWTIQFHAGECGHAYMPYAPASCLTGLDQADMTASTYRVQPAFRFP